MTLDIAELFAEREGERYAMHSRYLNEQMVRVLKTIGYDIGFCQRHAGNIFTTARGADISICSSGWGVFALGRNHPAVRDALHERARRRSAQPRAAGCFDAGRRSG